MDLDDPALLQAVGREHWCMGSAVEIFSNSDQRWYIGWVVAEDPGDVLRVLFDDRSPTLKSKLLARGDGKLGLVGVNVRRLPPHCEIGRDAPGGGCYLVHLPTGRRCASLEETWSLHFDVFLRSHVQSSSSQVGGAEGAVAALAAMPSPLPTAANLAIGSSGSLAPALQLSSAGAAAAAVWGGAGQNSVTPNQAALAMMVPPALSATGDVALQKELLTASQGAGTAINGAAAAFRFPSSASGPDGIAAQADAEMMRLHDSFEQGQAQGYAQAEQRLRVELEACAEQRGRMEGELQRLREEAARGNALLQERDAALHLLRVELDRAKSERDASQRELARVKAELGVEGAPSVFRSVSANHREVGGPAVGAACSGGVTVALAPAAASSVAGMGALDLAVPSNLGFPSTIHDGQAPYSPTRLRPATGLVEPPTPPTAPSRPSRGPLAAVADGNSHAFSGVPAGLGGAGGALLSAAFSSPPENSDPLGGVTLDLGPTTAATPLASPLQASPALAPSPSMMAPGPVPWLAGIPRDPNNEAALGLDITAISDVPEFPTIDAHGDISAGVDGNSASASNLERLSHAYQGAPQGAPPPSAERRRSASGLAERGGDTRERSEVSASMRERPVQICISVPRAISEDETRQMLGATALPGSLAPTAMPAGPALHHQNLSATLPPQAIPQVVMSAGTSSSQVAVVPPPTTPAVMYRASPARLASGAAGGASSWSGSGGGASSSAVTASNRNPNVGSGSAAPAMASDLRGKLRAPVLVSQQPGRAGVQPYAVRHASAGVSMGAPSPISMGVVSPMGGAVLPGVTAPLSVGIVYSR